AARARSAHPTFQGTVTSSPHSCRLLARLENRLRPARQGVGGLALHFAERGQRRPGDGEAIVFRLLSAPAPVGGLIVQELPGEAPLSRGGPAGSRGAARLEQASDELGAPPFLNFLEARLEERPLARMMPAPLRSP